MAKNPDAAVLFCLAFRVSVTPFLATFQDTATSQEPTEPAVSFLTASASGDDSVLNLTRF